jgi:hypothetical protein
MARPILIHFCELFGALRYQRLQPINFLGWAIHKRVFLLADD